MTIHPQGAARGAAVLGLLALVALTAAPASAGGARTEQLRGHATLAKGTLDRLSLDADGVLRLGPAFTKVPLDADTAWCQVTSGKALWIGLGNKPALFRYAAGKGKRFVLGDGLMVTALATLPEGAVAAAVFPGARLVKVGPDGHVDELARLPVQHVWALAADASGTLTAACGVPGALYRVDPFGGVTKLADVDDTHARCLTPARDGTSLFVGTAPKGLVLRWDGAKLSVVRDLEPQEVVGIVERRDGSLIVAANADQAGGNAQKMASILRAITNPGATKPGDKPAPRAALQDGVILHIEREGAVTTLWQHKKTAVLCLAPDGDGAVAGTYPGSRLVGVDPGSPFRLLADLSEAEASLTIARKGHFAAAVTSNPAVLYVLDDTATSGTWTSAPVDAGAPARWGRVTLWGQGVRAVDYRTGPTEEPDDAWGDWRPLAGFDGTAGAMEATARFVQWRVTLGATGELRSLSAVHRDPNRAPVITALEVAKPGQDDEGSPVATPERQITWKATDEDDDELRSTVRVRRKGSPHWIKLVDAKELEKTAWTWDTSGLPDGDYEVEVRVDDGASNEPGRQRQAKRVLAGVRVDNTPPTVTVKARRGRGRVEIEGLAQDANGGRVLSVRVSLNGGPWIPLGAKDGLYDTDREPYAGSVKVKAGAGSQDVVVQVMDADGNLAAAAAVVP